MTDLTEHKIDTGNSYPIKQAPRRIPLAKMAEVEKEMQDMLEKGVIEQSDSPWSSPVVLVKKKDNSLRFCIDYRKLNEKTLKDSHPIPRIDTTLDALSGSKYYSTIDLKSGYWQVKVSPEDRPKTAFSIPGGGHWQFVSMPFGLCNAPATFERLMEKVLANLSWKICMVYLDDIIVLSRTFQEHLKNLELVFSRLSNANLKMNPKKCNFLQKQVAYLGHVINEQGIQTDPAKIQSVTSWPIPATVKDVRGFLGLCGYYRKFVNKFSDIARPLHKLTEKNVKFNWTTDCQEAFDKLKRALTSSPILSYPQPNLPFVLDTDASNTGAGAVLSQIQNGKEVVVSYYSKTFSNTERKYCVTRRELLAIILSVKHFHHYLYGQRFKIRTDHGSLRWLLQFKNPEGQIARWLETLASYQFTIEHRAGRSHGNADALSRRPCSNSDSDCKHCAKAEAGFSPETVKTQFAAVTTRSQATVPKTESTESKHETISISEYQSNDPILKKVISWVQTKQKPPWEEISHLDATSKYYWARFDSLIYERDILYHKWEDSSPKFQAVVPSSLTEEVLRGAHDSLSGGHLGIKKTLSKIRDKYMWHHMAKDVKHYCQLCDKCAARKGPGKTPKAPLQKYIVGVPMERWAVDVLGPLPLSNKKNLYLLVIGDYFTKWVDAIPMKNQKVTTIAHKIIDRIVTIFGVPMAIHSDQGRSFESEIFQEMCTILGIEKTRTTPYRPQSDGMIERANRTIADMLTAFVSKNQKDWDDLIPILMLAYRSSVHESTGISPNEMVFGRTIALPSDLVLGRVEPETENTNSSKFADSLADKLAKVHDLARQKLNLSCQNMIREYNTKLQLNSYTPGSPVWLHTQKKSKLGYNWEGPYIVTKKINDVVYTVKKGPKSNPKTVHHNHLKPYKGKHLPTWFSNK